MITWLTLAAALTAALFAVPPGLFYWRKILSEQRTKEALRKMYREREEAKKFWGPAALAVFVSWLIHRSG